MGRVVVRFVVSKTGDITNVEVLRSAYPDLDAEAVRVIKQMPRWTPGSENGEVVSVWYVLPINFELSGGKSKRKKKR